MGQNMNIYEILAGTEPLEYEDEGGRLIIEWILEKQDEVV
jgi:hypothetical protein